MSAKCNATLFAREARNTVWGERKVEGVHRENEIISKGGPNTSVESSAGEKGVMTEKVARRAEEREKKMQALGEATGRPSQSEETKRSQKLSKG